MSQCAQYVHRSTCATVERRLEVELLIVIQYL